MTNVRHYLGKFYHALTGRETKHYQPCEEKVSDRTRGLMAIFTGVGLEGCIKKGIVSVVSDRFVINI
jgi:hypothetical protein